MRDLRISVIDACNYRCTYCMPLEEYPDSYVFADKKDRLSFDEITRIVSIFVDLGVSKIRITGGEPLLRKDLPNLISSINAQKGIDDLALTTNGHLAGKICGIIKGGWIKTS